jgi:hypothetical protein
VHDIRHIRRMKNTDAQTLGRLAGKWKVEAGCVRNSPATVVRLQRGVVNLALEKIGRRAAGTMTLARRER